jgi:DNA mismatch endonuclease, patch repair protein
MSLIRAKDTKPEIKVRSFLYRHGLRYRLYCNNLPGKPDLVLHKYKCVVFVHGCFWHGHSDLACKRSNIPKSNTEYWTSKIEKNKARDKKNIENIKKLGWRVFIIWECEVKSEPNLLKLINAIKNINQF